MSLSRVGSKFASWRPTGRHMAGRQVAFVAFLIMAICIPSSHSFSTSSHLGRVFGRHSQVLPPPSRRMRGPRTGLAGIKLDSRDDPLAAEWSALPQVDRAQAIRIAAGAALTGGGLRASAVVTKGDAGPETPRSAANIESWAALPVWPVWPTFASPTGGRVR